MITNSPGVEVRNGNVTKLAFGVIVEDSRNVVVRDRNLTPLEPQVPRYPDSYNIDDPLTDWSICPTSTHPAELPS